jgi:hypothetical protein
MPTISELETTMQINIRDIVLFKGEPPHSNPYLVNAPNYVDGLEREVVIKQYLEGRKTEGYTFWYAPAGGGARRLYTTDTIQQ